MVPLLLLAVIATAPTRIVLNAGSFSCGGFVVAETMETSPPAVVRAQLDAANAASVVLDPTSDWRISLNESRCWATPAYLLKTDGSRDQIAIQTWPARQLKGRSSVQAAALTVTLQSPQAAEDVIPLREKVVQDCRVDGLRWQCTVPATMIDARLAATGFAPVYLWNRDLRKNDLDVGTVKLERGASVIGWITNPDGESAADAEVVLRPSAMAETAGLTQQFDAQVLKVTTTAQGFFQIQAVPPGTYSLTARAVGMSPERVEDIRITEPNEYAIDEIHLATLGRLSLSITPAATPKGGLWQVKLRPLTKIDTPPAKFEPRPANDDGQWNQGGLERGTYRVLVYDDAGARVAEREVIMQSDLETVQITVDAIPVEGRVRVGSKPVPGKLRFETDGAKVEIETDANGEFTGSLPNEGTWRVQVTPTAARQRLRVQKVTVEREDGGATARVDIDLPGGVIEGIVVDSLGKGVPDAEVIVRRGTLLEANGATDETGHFRLFGLREGEVAVLAVKRGVQSDELKQVVAKNATPVTLELRETGNITGRIVRMDGSPVTGAVVRYLYGTRSAVDAERWKKNYELAKRRDSKQQ